MCEDVGGHGYIEGVRGGKEQWKGGGRRRSFAFTSIILSSAYQ